MNEIQQRWLEQNRGKHEILFQSLENGFELMELRDKVVLVWAGDSAHLGVLADRVKITKGEQAYVLRDEGHSWKEIGDDLIHIWPSNACKMAKRWSKQKGLPWPPV
jgi:hypothetical protein